MISAILIIITLQSYLTLRLSSGERITIVPKEIFFDHLILDKISTDANFIDIGSCNEINELMSKKYDEKKQLLDEIYETAKKILSTSQLQVFVAVHKYGYKIPMLARAHGVKRSTYYTHYYRALTKLQKEMVDKQKIRKKKMNVVRIKKIKARNWNPLKYKKRY